MTNVEYLVDIVSNPEKFKSLSPELQKNIDEVSEFNADELKEAAPEINELTAKVRFALAEKQGINTSVQEPKMELSPLEYAKQNARTLPEQAAVNLVPRTINALGTLGQGGVLSDISKVVSAPIFDFMSGAGRGIKGLYNLGKGLFSDDANLSPVQMSDYQAKWNPNKGILSGENLSNIVGNVVTDPTLPLTGGTGSLAGLAVKSIPSLATASTFLGRGLAGAVQGGLSGGIQSGIANIGENAAIGEFKPEESLQAIGMGSAIGLGLGGAAGSLSKLSPFERAGISEAKPTTALELENLINKTSSNPAQKMDIRDAYTKQMTGIDEDVIKTLPPLAQNALRFADPKDVDQLVKLMDYSHADASGAMHPALDKVSNEIWKPLGERLTQEAKARGSSMGNIEKTILGDAEKVDMQPIYQDWQKVVHDRLGVDIVENTKTGEIDIIHNSNSTIGVGKDKELLSIAKDIFNPQKRYLDGPGVRALERRLSSYLPENKAEWGPSHNVIQGTIASLENDAGDIVEKQLLQSAKAKGMSDEAAKGLLEQYKKDRRGYGESTQAAKQLQKLMGTTLKMTDEEGVIEGAARGSSLSQALGQQADRNTRILAKFAQKFGMPDPSKSVGLAMTADLLAGKRNPTLAAQLTDVLAKNKSIPQKIAGIVKSSNPRAETIKSIKEAAEKTTIKTQPKGQVISELATQGAGARLAPGLMAGDYYDKDGILRDKDGNEVIITGGKKKAAKLSDLAGKK